MLLDKRQYISSKTGEIKLRHLLQIKHCAIFGAVRDRKRLK